MRKSYRIIEKEKFDNLRALEHQLFNLETLRFGHGALFLYPVFKKKFDSFFFLPWSFNFICPLHFDEEVDSYEYQQRDFRMFTNFINQVEDTHFFVSPADDIDEIYPVRFEKNMDYETYRRAISTFPQEDQQAVVNYKYHSYIDRSTVVLTYGESGSWAMASDIFSDLVFVGLEKSVKTEFKTCFSEIIMDCYSVSDFLGDRIGGSITQEARDKIIEL